MNDPFAQEWGSLSNLPDDDCIVPRVHPRANQSAPQGD